MMQDEIKKEISRILGIMAVRTISPDDLVAYANAISTLSDTLYVVADYERIKTQSIGIDG